MNYKKSPKQRVLTGALPLGAAWVRAGEDGQTQQAAVGLAGVVATVEGGVVQEQLPVEADELGTLVQAVRVRWLWGGGQREYVKQQTQP